jgi:hypothetical protein
VEALKITASTYTIAIVVSHLFNGHYAIITAFDVYLSSSIINTVLNYVTHLCVPFSNKQPLFHEY